LLSEVTAGKERGDKGGSFNLLKHGSKKPKRKLFWSSKGKKAFIE